MKDYNATYRSKLITAEQVAELIKSDTDIIVAQCASEPQGCMNYEVAQTEPQITGVTPPIATSGFGSTSGGAYGTSNVQKYIKITK